ncbi:MAG: peptidase dimerization domain-containing protein [Lachnospiraceae bacterium]
MQAALALHVFSQKPLGTLGGHTNPCAKVYGFRIKFTGKGVHGSSPEDGIDPINTAVHIHQGLQELIAVMRMNLPGPGKLSGKWMIR